MATVTYKEVVVIGNGPSAITLSYMLAGNWPFYVGSFHPVEFLHRKLDESKDKSLVEQDLRYLSEGLEGRSRNPVSVLFDTINHPDADLGIENPSLLKWRHLSKCKVDHAVLGKGLPGGAWQKMEGGTLTISLGSWMELPNLSIKGWDTAKYRTRTGLSGLRQKRATVGSVAKYYSHYVDSQDLDEYFFNNATVTCVTPVCHPYDGEEYAVPPRWEVHGHKLVQCQENGETITENFVYVTPHVVLATGNSDQPNRLHVPGEELPFVMHSLAHLEELILRGILNSMSKPLLVVGAGLSAADAIIASRFYGIPVVHIFRRHVDDEDLVFNKLPENMYPEYHKVHQMMKDANGEHYEGYKAYPSYQVSEIYSDGQVLLVPFKGDGSAISVHVSYVLVLIGMRPDLSFLEMGNMNLGIYPHLPADCKNNPVNINLYTHECVNHPGVFAMGPLVGDNFVRFVQGGALAITNYIHQKRKSSVK